MTVLRIDKFRGEAPSVDEQALDDDQAAVAENVELWTGALRPYRERQATDTPTKTGTIQTIFPFGASTTYWAHWTQVVNAVKSPVDDDATERFYYSGHNVPKISNEAMAIDGGTNYPMTWYQLGIPSPETAPTVAANPAGTTPTDRSYVYTFVSQWGEESAPSPASAIVAIDESDGQCDLSAIENTALPNSYTLTDVSLSGEVVTFTTSAAHYLRTGESITISGALYNSYDVNGTWAVTRISSTQFSITVPGLSTFNEVTNGGFDSGTGWTTGTGWTIGSGVANADGTGSSADLTNSPVLVKTVPYLVTFTVSNYVSGNVTPRIMTTAGTARSANGTYSEVITAGATAPMVVFRSGANPNEFSGDIDDVIVQHDWAAWTVAREAPINTISTIRLYRATTASSGTEYLYVAEWAFGTATYSDTIRDAALGEVLPSSGWLMPPTDLANLNVLPNGILVGTSGKYVYFCEPYAPYAWPTAYRQQLDFDPVGVGVWGNNAVVATEGVPYVFTGSHSANMQGTRTQLHQACVSQQSVVTTGKGVVYASNEGLAFVGSGGSRLITAETVRKREWDGYSPSSMIGAILDRRVVMFYDTGTEWAGLTFDSVDGTVVSADARPTAVHYDLLTDYLYTLEQDGTVYKWDAQSGNKTYTWKSKAFETPRPLNFAGIKLDVVYGSGITAAELEASLAAELAELDLRIAAGTEWRTGGLNGHAVNHWEVNGDAYKAVHNTIVGEGTSAHVRVWADGVLKLDKDVPTDGVIRMPGGFLATLWQVEVSANILCKSVVLAESMRALRAA